MKRSNSASRYLLLALAIFAIFILLTAFQVNYFFEDGAYGKFTLSALHDGDFNIIKQDPASEQSRNWLVSKTGYSPSFEHPAVSGYLAPFYLYQIGLDKLAGESSEIFNSRFMPVHILSTIFFTALGLLVLAKLLDAFGFYNRALAVALVATSTPFLYYFAFCSTNVDIFANSYAILALSVYWNLRSEKEIRPTQLIALGAIAGFGLAIRIHLFWISILYTFFIWNFPHKGQNFSWILMGAVLPAGFVEMNNFMITEQILPPLQVYLEGYDLGDFLVSSAQYNLFGPNGTLPVSPVFVGIGAGLGAALSHRKKIGWILFAIAISALPFYFRMYTTWVISDELNTRHLVDFFFASVIFLCALMDWTMKQKWQTKFTIWFFLALCPIWHGVVTMCFFYVSESQSWNWQYEYGYKIDGIIQALTYLGDRFNTNSISAAVKNSFHYLPLIFGISFLLMKVHENGLRKLHTGILFFFASGLTIFGVFSVSNRLLGPANVEKLRAQNFYAGKTTATDQHVFLFDDYEEEMKKTAYWYIKNGDCESVNKLIKINSQFLMKVKDATAGRAAVLQRMISEQKFPQSALDNPQFATVFQQQFAKVCEH